MSFPSDAHRKEVGTRLEVSVRPDGLARWTGNVLRACGWHIAFGVAPHPMVDGYWVRAALQCGAPGGGFRFLTLGAHAMAGPGVTGLNLMVTVETDLHQFLPWDAETESALLDLVEQTDTELGQIAHVPAGWFLVKGWWVDPRQAARFGTRLRGQAVAS